MLECLKEAGAVNLNARNKSGKTVGDLLSQRVRDRNPYDTNLEDIRNLVISFLLKP